MSTLESRSGARIVVGIDGSEPSKHALRWAREAAELRHASIEVVTAWEWPTTFGWAPPFPEGFDPSDDARRAAQEELVEVLGAEDAAQVTVTVVEGSAALALVRAAEGADLLVVGSRGHGGFAGLLLGSVSSHCAAHAPCPVLVVR